MSLTGTIVRSCMPFDPVLLSVQCRNPDEPSGSMDKRKVSSIRQEIVPTEWDGPVFSLPVSLSFSVFISSRSSPSHACVSSHRKKRQEAGTNTEMFPDCCRFPGSGKNRTPETGLPAPVWLNNMACTGHGFRQPANSPELPDDPRPPNPASHIVRTTIPAGFTSRTKITAAFFSVNKTPPEKTLPQKQASPIRPAPDAAFAILTTNLSTAIGDNRKHTPRKPAIRQTVPNTGQRSPQNA